MRACLPTRLESEMDWKPSHEQTCLQVQIRGIWAAEPPKRRLKLSTIDDLNDPFDPVSLEPFGQLGLDVEAISVIS